jgi:hypothetical protein
MVGGPWLRLNVALGIVAIELKTGNLLFSRLHLFALDRSLAKIIWC